jgi:hypothetical protein
MSITGVEEIHVGSGEPGNVMGGPLHGQERLRQLLQLPGGGALGGCRGHLALQHGPGQHEFVENAQDIVVPRDGGKHDVVDHGRGSVTRVPLP